MSVGRGEELTLGKVYSKCVQCEITVDDCLMPKLFKNLTLYIDPCSVQSNQLLLSLYFVMAYMNIAMAGNNQTRL